MYVGIIFALLTGLFFLIGIVISKRIKNQERMAYFTTSLAFGVIGGLLFLDLLPELIEVKDIYLIIPIIIGFLIMIFLDKLIPNHNHIDNDDYKHLNHIGIITILALAIHNMIEGITLYSISLNNFKSGLLMMISISLHNIPLGLQIGNSLDNLKKNIPLITFLCISSFLGAILMIIFNGFSDYIINILLALTFGILSYILIFELFSEIKAKLETLYGIIIGIVILIITSIL